MCMCMCGANCVERGRDETEIQKTVGIPWDKNKCNGMAVSLKELNIELSYAQNIYFGYNTTLKIENGLKTICVYAYS